MKGVPEGPRRRAFRAFVRELQDSPTFRNNRTIKTWKIDGGDPPATADQLPCARVVMLGGPVRRLAATPMRGQATYAIESKPSVVVEFWTSTGDQGDAQDLGDLICATLFPSDPAARMALDARLRAVGIVDVHQTTDLLPRTLDDVGKVAVAAVGVFTLTLHLAS